MLPIATRPKMERLKTISQICFYLAGTAVFLFSASVAIQLRELTLDTREHLSGIVSEVDSTLQRVSSMADTGEKAAEEQRLYWQKNSQQIGQVLKEQEAAAKSVRQAIDQTSGNLNEKILPQLAEAIKNNDQRAAALAQDAEKVLADLSGLLEQHRRLAATLEAQASDPAIAQSAKNIEQLTANAEQTRQRLDELLIELKKVAKTGKLTLLLQGLSAVAGVFH